MLRIQTDHAALVDVRFGIEGSPSRRALFLLCAGHRSPNARRRQERHCRVAEHYLPDPTPADRRVSRTRAPSVPWPQREGSALASSAGERSRRLTRSSCVHLLDRIAGQDAGSVAGLTDAEELAGAAIFRDRGVRCEGAIDPPVPPARGCRWMPPMTRSWRRTSLTPVSDYNHRKGPGQDERQAASAANDGLSEI